jgi:uncharacterized protein YndB with AHSA1/START domain
MTDQEQARRATVTTPSDREIHVEREFDAPRDLVFSTFTDPALTPEWWGPTTVVDEMDVRPGGSWRFVILGEDGSEETAFRGTYRRSRRPSGSSRPSSGKACRATFTSRRTRSRTSATARGSAPSSSSTASRTATVSSAPEWSRA